MNQAVSADVPASDSPSSLMCSVHSDRPCRYVCMDISCCEPALCCILCIKNKHQSCDDKFILERESLDEQIVLKNVSGAEMENFKSDIRKILQEMHAYLTQKYKKYMGESLNYLGSDGLTLAQLSSAETLKALKENCNVKMLKDKKLEISPKIDPTKESIKNDLRSFKEDLRALVDGFAKDLNEIRFTSADGLNLKDFTWHKNLDPAMKGSSINLKRKDGNNEMNYFMMVSKNPVKKFKYKVKITGIYSTDRFLDMGLVSETRKNSCANLVNSFGSSGNHSFCGYSQSGMSGKTLSTSSSSGFNVGMEIFLEFNGKQLTIYTQDKKADLKKDLPSGKFYLFFVLYHKDASCILTRLK